MIIRTGSRQLKFVSTWNVVALELGVGAPVAAGVGVGAPVADGVGVGAPVVAGEALEVGTPVGVEMETVAVPVGAPHPTKTTTAANDSRGRRTFVVGGIVVTLRLIAEREPVVSMLVELRPSPFVTNVGKVV
jgi:hypothetical protein